MTGQRRVIDSNMLQSEELRQFLIQHRTNFAVITEFAWFEIYKQQSEAAIVAGLSVLGQFPEQIIVLRSSGEIANMDPRISNMTDAMQHSEVALNIRQMVEAVTGPSRDPEQIRAQMQQQWARASALLPDLLEGAAEIMTSLPEMEEQMFTRNEVRIIRNGARYTPDMFASIFGAADQIWEMLSAPLDSDLRQLDERYKTKAYLYRYSLALVVYLLRWIMNGSQPHKRLERTRNDLIDLCFAVYGTYYEGLMTADRKASWMHDQLSRALSALGADVPSLRSLLS